MFDPQSLTLFASFFGSAAAGLLKKAAEDRAASWLGKLVGQVQGVWKKGDLEEALERAYGFCMESILGFLKVQGYDEADLAAYKPSFEALLNDPAVGAEMDLAIDAAADWPGPEPQVFRDAWERVTGPPLPAEFQWTAALKAFKAQVARHKVIPPDLKERLAGLQLERLREEVRAQGGVRPAYDLRRYARRIRDKYKVVDLSAVARPADEENPLSLLQVFLPQDVREDPPKAELPRDLLQWVEGKRKEDPSDGKEADEVHLRLELERAREAYARKPRQPVLELLGRPDSARVVLLGDPGAGKSALARFLLLTLLEPFADGAAAASPDWAAPFAGHLPLLIEIKDFLARRGPGCETFVEYLHTLGEREGYHLEQLGLDECLRQEPTLVLFDGLDEVFDPGERERIAQEIAGFAATYHRPRVIVTSRPVGYLEGPLRGAGFRHFALQELDREQIERFVRGWYDLTFPGKPEEAAPRVERVLRAIEQSRSVALLAGNPLLLTVMALLGRQQELPRERASFYQHASEVLCHHWDVNKHLQKAGIREYVGIDDKREILRRLAFRMQSGAKGLAGNYLREEELRDDLETYFRDRYLHPPAEAKSAALAMVAELRERNYVLCLYGPGVYGFVHRTFLEYFCAAELVRRLHEDPEYPIERLLQEVYGQHWWDPVWQEVLRLVCGMTGEKYAGQIVEFLAGIDGPFQGYSIPSNLLLATYCLSEVRNRPALAEPGKALLQAISRRLQVREVYDRSFLAAAREIGTTWPGSQEFERRFLTTPFLRTRPVSSYLEAELAVAILPRTPQLLSVLKAQLRNLNAEIRRAVPGALALGWSQDSEVRQLLFDVARSDQDWGVRSSALQALASGWSQRDDVREILFDSARSDRAPAIRSSALQALASGWSQRDDVRRLLFEAARSDQDPDVRTFALRALASGWSQRDDVRQLLFEATRSVRAPAVRISALQALASGWSQRDDVRQLLFEAARSDQEPDVRTFALRALTSGWSQRDDVRLLLFEAARSDQDSFVRSSALEALASGWSQLGDVRQLLFDAAQAEEPVVRRRALQGLARDLESMTKRILSRDLDGGVPFLDPRAPLPSGHVRRAAAQLHLAEEEIREKIAAAAGALGLRLFEASEP